MPNQLKGEVEIEFHGKKRLLRPTFDAICEIESRAGEGIPFMISRISSRTLGFKHVAAIIYGGMLGAGSAEMSFEQVGQVVMKKGFGKFILPCSELLANAMTPDEEQPDSGKESEKPEHEKRS